MVGNVDGLQKELGNSSAAVVADGMKNRAVKTQPERKNASAEGSKDAVYGSTPQDIVDIAGIKTQGKEDDKSKKQEEKMDPEDVKMMNEQLNKFMDSMNCNIHFDYYEELNQMQVQIINKKTNEVIREFPPKEILDKLVGLREWLGTVMDKKA